MRRQRQVDHHDVGHTERDLLQTRQGIGDGIEGHARQLGPEKLVYRIARGDGHLEAFQIGQRKAALDVAAHDDDGRRFDIGRGEQHVHRALGCLRHHRPDVVLAGLGAGHRLLPILDLNDLEAQPQLLLQQRDKIGTDAAKHPLFVEIFEWRKMRIRGQPDHRM